MEPIYLNITFFIEVYVILVFSDYYRHNTFNWLENFCAIFIICYIQHFFDWLIDN
ncbi:hypothetical protein [Metabacillus fastidiosus]|uniref:hypothetical protein n=1 Tax=Metabacillus fastidiosus TaxID=1458 RepID=UPI003D29C36C